MEGFEGPLVAAHGIHKQFGGIKALDDVSLEVRPAEIHALVGENGAGKSTLVKVMTGAQRPDVGHGQHSRRARERAEPREGARARDRRRLPGAESRALPHRAREHVPGSRAPSPARRARAAGDAAAGAAGARPRRRGRRPRPRGLRSQRRRASARRDRPRARAQRPRSDLRRAVGDPLRPRAGARVRGHSGAQGERPRHPLHLSPAGGDLPPRRPGDRAEGRPRRRDASGRGPDDGRADPPHGGSRHRRATGAGGSRSAGRAGGAGPGAAPGRRARPFRAARGRGTRRRRPCRLEPLAARERPRRDPSRAVGQGAPERQTRSGSGGLATPCVPASSSSRRTGSARG